MYTGKEKCQGCGKSGAENPRWEKDNLCESCKSLLNLGKAKDVELTKEYKDIRQHLHAYSTNELNSIVHEILGALNNPTVGRTAVPEALFYSSGDNVRYYHIEAKLFEPLRKLFGDLNTLYRDVKKQQESIPADVRLETDMYKNEIYNQGVARGRNLLIQLNSGGITPEDFLKDQRYENNS